MKQTILGIFAAALLLAPAAFAQGVVVDGDPAQDAVVVTSAVSRAFFLDTREGPRESDGSETLTYSILWSGGGDGEVRILQNGVELTDPMNPLMDEGEWPWRVTKDGTYVLKHVTMMGDEEAAVETATFVVKGLNPKPPADVSATLKWKYAKNANGWYCAQVAITWRADYAKTISNMRLLFADRKDANGKRLAYLVDPSTALDPLGSTEKYDGKAYRAVKIDLKAFKGLKDGARAIVGASDATIKSSVASVPKGERKICLFVTNRTLATLKDSSAILAWDVGGKTRYMTLKSVVMAPAPALYTVRFSAGDGTGKMAAQTMVTGRAAKLSANAFTRKGWVFAGWATKKGGAIAYTDGKSVKNLCAAGKTVTLYAVWAKPAYKVKFFANNGTDETAVQKFKYGKKQSLRANTFKRKGYAFAGWAKSAAAAKEGKVAYADGKAVKNLVTTGKTVKLYAVWKKK